MKCSISIFNDYAVVKADDASLGTLKFDMSLPYCKIFETTKQQSRDYVEELVHWCGGRPDNIDTIAKSILLYVAVKRREAGLE